MKPFIATMLFAIAAFLFGLAILHEMAREPERERQEISHYV